MTQAPQPRNGSVRAVTALIETGENITTKDLINEANSGGQTRVAVRFAKAYGNRFICVHEGKTSKWYYWSGVRWKLDVTNKFEQCLLKVLGKMWREALANQDLRTVVRSCQSASAHEGIKKIAGALPEFALEANQLDCDPYLWNCLNGTLDLRTLELRPHDPADLITMVCNASYDPDADYTLWEEFYLSKVLPSEDVRGFLQRVTGLMLIGVQREHILPIFTGSGRNGKGVYERVIRYVLGDYAILAAADLFTASPNAHTTSQLDLRGKRLAVVNETEKGAKLSEALVKAMTGGGSHRARGMHQDNVEFEQSHLAIMITNDLPRVTGEDAAIWDRLTVIPFNIYIPREEQDPDLDDKLKAIGSGILLWAVRGWLDYRDHGGLRPPGAVQARTERYREDSDFVGKFIDECCVRDIKSNTSGNDLLKAYRQWINYDTALEIGLHEFIKALKKRGIPRSTRGAKPMRGIRLLSTT